MGVQKSKICSKCKRIKNLSDFYLKPSAKDGRMSACKVCKNKQHSEYVERKKENIRAYNRERYVPHPVCPAVAIIMAPVFAERKALQKKAREKSEAVVAYRKKYKALTKERNRERIKAAHIKERRNKKLKERRKVDRKFTINQSISCAINASLKRKGAAKNNSWSKIVGFNIDELMIHLERQFLKGMCWDNRDEWEIDHIIPLSSFIFVDASDAEFKAAWHISNLRPLWKSDNRSKRDKRIHLL